MATVQAVNYNVALFYDGTNAAEIQDNATLNPVVLDDDNGTLTLNRVVGGTVECPPNRWITFTNGNVYQVMDDTTFNATFVLPVSSAALEELDTGPDGLTGFGSAAVPGILLGNDATVSVPISPAQPDATYAVTAYLVGNNGGLSITGTAVVDNDTVEVTVHAAVAYVSGAQVLVTARP